MSEVWYVHKFADWGVKSDEFAWYRLHLPHYPESGYYRQGRSFNSFFHPYGKKISEAIKKYGIHDSRVAKLLPNRTPDGFLLMARPDCEFESEQEISVKCGADPVRVAESHKVTAEFNSIWEFYDFIGFDHKTRKYRVP